MIGRLLALAHTAIYGMGHAIADACDPNEVQPSVTVKSYTRKRPLQDKREALHARLRDELEGRAHV